MAELLWPGQKREGRFVRVRAGYALALLAIVSPATVAWCGENTDRWIPARWSGGPLEVAHRSKDRDVALDTAAREALTNWYQPATLDLLKGTPINCLLVTLSAGSAREVEEQQRKLVTEYARLARQRQVAVLGIVYAGADLSTAVSSASEARLDGLVLDGEFAAGDVENLEAELRSTNAAAVVIPIVGDAASMRTARAALVAVSGVRPKARDLAEMGIRAGPSSEPWIDSNIWLVRSFRLAGRQKTIWVSQEPDPNSVGDYVRCVADAAVAGGRWIITLDDDLRARLCKKEAEGLATWSAIANYLNFAESHAEWRSFLPYGNLGIIVDTAGPYPDVSNEYLNLVARRQIPYRIIERSRLDATSLGTLRAVLAVDLAPPTETERPLLRAFAENGGLVIAGPSWGAPPAEDPFIERSLGKGRVIVYKDEPPDPEAVARDMLELLAPEVMGVTAFNVPSVLTYASTADNGKGMLIQLLNYAGTPFDRRITLRVNGTFKTARLYTPEEAPADLTTRNTPDGRTQVSIPRLAVWGALLLE